MTNTVEQHVRDFQLGNAEAFEDIYEKLLSIKSQVISKLRKSLPSSVDNFEISAMYDDVVWKCSCTYQADLGTAFTTFLYKAAENECKMRIRSLNAEKRAANFYGVSLDSTENSEDGSVALLNTLADEAAIDAQENVECLDMVELLEDFSSRSRLNKEYADLLIFNALPYTSNKEKHAVICDYLGETITASAIHKRIKRARSAFKKHTEIAA